MSKLETSIYPIDEIISITSDFKLVIFEIDTEEYKETKKNLPRAESIQLALKI